MENFKKPVLTVDGLIKKNAQILLVKRAIKPFKGSWTLPGGHVECGERVEQALKREIKEELSVQASIKKLVGVYSDPQRDPRYHSVSIVFACQIDKGQIKLNREASDFKYFALDNLPDKIGFDHRKIIKDL